MNGTTTGTGHSSCANQRTATALKPVIWAFPWPSREGIPVVISTRMQNGRVMPIDGYDGGRAKLKKAGAIFADNLSPQKARILLMLALQTTSDPGEIQKMFDK
jgi:L-asparaginase